MAAEQRILRHETDEGVLPAVWVHQLGELTERIVTTSFGLVRDTLDTGERLLLSVISGAREVAVGATEAAVRTVAQKREALPKAA